MLNASSPGELTEVSSRLTGALSRIQEPRGSDPTLPGHGERQKANRLLGNVPDALVHTGSKVTRLPGRTSSSISQIEPRGIFMSLGLNNLVFKYDVCYLF